MQRIEDAPSVLEYDPSEWNFPSHQCEGQICLTESPEKLSVSQIKAQSTM